MGLASAYPNSDLSALSMTVIAVVMASTLAIWLILVFLADRQPRRRTPRLPPAEGDAALWTEDSLPDAERHAGVATAGAPPASQRGAPPDD